MEYRRMGEVKYVCGGWGGGGGVRERDGRDRPAKLEHFLLPNYSSTRFFIFLLL